MMNWLESALTYVVGRTASNLLEIDEKFHYACKNANMSQIEQLIEQGM